MKKYSISLVIALAICLLFSACHTASAPQETDKQVGLNEISGTITDCTMHMVEILAEDGIPYLFDKSEATINGGENGLLVGESVTIWYNGKLDTNQKQQNVTVSAIDIISAPAQNSALQNSQIPENSPAPTEAPTNVSHPAHTKNANELLKQMTLEEKVGQMFIARCPRQNAAQLAAQYHLGGYILFADDFKNATRAQVKQAIQSYQNSTELGMLIGVDEEGGTVNRVSSYKQFRAAPFLSPQALYKQGGFDLIVSDTKEKATLLHSLGINLNFAPVCDISTNPSDFIYKRSFGKDAKQTAQYVSTVVSEMNRQNMGCVLKHFPGYGNNADTHTDVVHDSRSLASFRENDFLPFEAGIKAGAGCVLVAHNIVTNIDADLPASLSPAVHDILRDELGFSGIILTDDLAMDGVKKYTSDSNAAVLAVKAGNDLLTCTNFEEQIPAVIAAVKNGEIPESHINASVARILRYKLAMGIIQ